MMNCLVISAQLKVRLQDGQVDVDLFAVIMFIFTSRCIATNLHSYHRANSYQMPDEISDFQEKVINKLFSCQL